MNTKHTPGPWRFHHNEGQTFNFITDKYNNCIAKALINEHHIPADVAEENARLIAASPSFFEYICKKANEGCLLAIDILKNKGYAKGKDY